MTTVRVWAHSEYAIQYDVGDNLPGSTFEWCGHWTKSGLHMCVKPRDHFVRAYMNLTSRDDNEEHHCHVSPKSIYEELQPHTAQRLIRQRLTWTAHVCETCEEEAMTA